MERRKEREKEEGRGGKKTGGKGVRKERELKRRERNVVGERNREEREGKYREGGAKEKAKEKAKERQSTQVKNGHSYVM